MYAITLGGTFVEGKKLRNAFRWKETIGSWETRPGHFNDAWDYWTDDGLGFLEMLQVSPFNFFTINYDFVWFYM